MWDELLVKEITSILHIESRGANALDHYNVGSIGVSIILGQLDDSKLDLVVKAQDIPLGVPPIGARTGGVTGITIKEASNAENIIHWPTINISNPNRRKEIYKATSEALDNAAEIKATQIGFFTMGLEVARLPTWEIAEEIVKAIVEFSKRESFLNKIMLVGSSPTQVSSFQFAINNIPIITDK